MKGTLSLFLFVFFSFFASSAYAQQLQEKEVYTFANSTLLEKIFEAKEITFKNPEHNKYSFQLKTYNVIALIDDGDLILRTYFKGKPSFTYAKINDFNAQYRWTRMYLDKDGDLVLAQEISFTGGIHIDNLYAAINTYGALLVAVGKHFE